MKPIHLWIIVGSLAALGVLRGVSSEAPRKPRTPSVAAVAPAAPEVPPLWEQVSAPQEAIQATAARLSVAPSSRSGFEEAAAQSIREFDQALSIRQQELSTPTPAGLSRDVQRALSRDSDARFDAARRRALDRMEPYLNRSAGHQKFRREFDTWAATLSAASRGIYR